MNEIRKSFSLEKYEVTLKVTKKSEGLRLDSFILTLYNTLSREFIKKKIAKGEIEILGRKKPHRASAKIHEGETIIIYFFRKPEEDEVFRGVVVPIQEDPDIIHEDESLIVISKPAFMVTHPTGRHIFNCATVYFESRYKTKIRSIHRLDRETSGILMLAKDASAAKDFSNYFEHGRAKKCYFFISVKRGEQTSFPFTAYERLQVGQTKEEFAINYFSQGSSKGRSAETSFEKVWENADYLIGLAFPKTGRQHQIRVHAAAHGYPLLGDKLYLGSYELFGRFKDRLATEEDHDLIQIPRHALHAIAIQVPFNPKEGEKAFSFISSIPKDLAFWVSEKFNLDIDELNEKLRKRIQEYFS